MKSFTYGTLSINLIFLLCGFFHGSPAYSTSIITVRTADTIFMGADSFTGDEGGSQIGTVCKIRQAGNVFFAVAGISTAENRKINFNIYNIAADIFSRDIPLRDKFSIYDAIDKWNLIQIVDGINTEKTSSEHSFYHNDHIAATTFIVMAGEKYPIAYTMEHIVINSPQEPAIIKSVIKPYDEPLETHVGFLYSSSEDRQICSHLTLGYNIRDLDKFIAKCIELITKERPRVKLPVDILRITNKGAEWIQHKKPECKEIQ